MIWTVVVDTATRMSWLQETDIDLANRRRDWLSLARPLWAGPGRWFPIEACLRPKRLRLLDCKSGPWPLLSRQTFSDGVALVALADACGQEMARLWRCLSPDRWRHRGLTHVLLTGWITRLPAVSIGKPSRLNVFCRWAPGTVCRMLPQPWPPWELCRMFP